MHTMSRATRVYHTRFYASDFTLTSQKAVKKAPPSESERERFKRIDWKGMERAAMNGQIPAPPVLRTEERCRWKLLKDVQEAAKAGDRRKLADLNIGNCNTVIRMIGKYRDLCLLALDRRNSGLSGT
jgi:hypothetical protein